MRQGRQVYLYVSTIMCICVLHTLLMIIYSNGSDGLSHSLLLCPYNLYIKVIEARVEIRWTWTKKIKAIETSSCNVAWGWAISWNNSNAHPRLSPKALMACSLIGSISGSARMNPGMKNTRISLYWIHESMIRWSRHGNCFVYGETGGEVHALLLYIYVNI